MMDTALILDRLLPAAAYQGVPGGTEAEYAALRWDDPRPKPTWSEIGAAWPAIQAGEAWKKVRQIRDARLTASDWTQMSDAPLTAGSVDAWREYRQTLRDVPQAFASPDAVVWPEAPGA